LSVEQIGFGLDFRMGVMQRSLGSMMVGGSPLRTPFVAALVALCLIWSILSLDMSRVRSTVVRFSCVAEKLLLTPFRNRYILELWTP
jgi:hypothetical protein